MNNGKLCGLVVLLCVICPILVGYVWPVGTTDEKGWEAGDPINISSDVINSDITVFAPYNDPFNNNMNVFDTVMFANDPVTTTSTPGPAWNVSYSSAYYQSVTTDSDGFYEISDISTWQNWASLGAKAVILAKSADWDEIDIDDNGSVADLIVFYPETQRMFFRVIGGHEFIAFNDSWKLTFSSPNMGVQTLTIPYIVYTMGSYVDLNDGFIFPFSADWFNGYENKAANIILSTTDPTSTVDLTFIDVNIYNRHDIKASVRVSYGDISLNVYDNSTLIYSEVLGDNSVYDKVLLTIDYDSKTVSLSGLRGMSSYIGDYSAAIRSTITCNLDNSILFRSINLLNYNQDAVVWYVADTVSGVSSTPGSQDYYLNMRDYDPTGALQINLRSVQIHSDRFDIVVNSTTYNGTIEGNMLTIETDGEDLKVPINNLLIGLIDNKVYLNGYLIADPGSFISSAQLRFYDDWLMSVYLYHMEEIDITGYTWMPGSFGLDIMGFCSVGLITSFGSALGLGLYGRRSGVRLGLVVMTALFCAAAYLIFMMGGGI